MVTDPHTDVWGHWPPPLLLTFEVTDPLLLTFGVTDHLLLTFGVPDPLLLTFGVTDNLMRVTDPSPTDIWGHWPPPPLTFGVTDHPLYWHLGSLTTPHTDIWGPLPPPTDIWGHWPPPTDIWGNDPPPTDTWGHWTPSYWHLGSLTPLLLTFGVTDLIILTLGVTELSQLVNWPVWRWEACCCSPSRRWRHPPRRSCWAARRPWPWPANNRVRVSNCRLKLSVSEKVLPNNQTRVYEVGYRYTGPFLAWSGSGSHFGSYMNNENEFKILFT